MSAVPERYERMGDAQQQRDNMENLVSELGEEFFSKMPQPLYWRVLVRPKQPAKMTKGGIALPQETRIAEGYRNYVGQIVAAGGEAFQSERFAREKRLPKVGDWCVYGRYAGQRLEYRGELLIVVNDDELLCVAPDPESLRIYV